MHRLSPLESPPAASGLTAAEALRFPAVQLFVERANDSLAEFEFSDADAPLVGDICNRLDGIALAIELAAARVDAFGVQGVAAHLDDRFRLLTKGRRTALPRHRTLSATLDWSYGLLTEFEQTVLRRLAIFAGCFTLDAAGAVAGDVTQPESEIIDQVAELISKSLVTADVADPEPRLRLLDTTRAYALEKLAGSGELHALARRHAEYYRDLVERAETEWETRAAAEWLADYGRQIDNLRAALDWAFSTQRRRIDRCRADGSRSPAMDALVIGGGARARTAQALAALSTLGDRDARGEMKLEAALATSLMSGRGACSRDQRCLDHRAADCGGPPRGRIPVAIAQGAVVFPRCSWRVSHRHGVGSTVPEIGGEPGRLREFSWSAID